jgi:hypothetical protein
MCNEPIYPGLNSQNEVLKLGHFYSINVLCINAQQHFICFGNLAEQNLNNRELNI